jgi:hypothetical protein
METKSFGILLSLLQMGQQTGTFWIEPSAVPAPQERESWMLGASDIDLADLPSWYALLAIKDGVVQQCGVFTRDGRLMLQGQEALEQLGRIHPIRYHLYDQLPMALLPSGVPSSASGEDLRLPSRTVPQRTPGSPGPPPFEQRCPILTPLGRAVLQQASSLTRYEGHLLRLCDGRRPVWRIAELLGIQLPADQEVFLQTIHSLSERGYLHFPS